SYKYKFLQDQSLDQKFQFHWQEPDSNFPQYIDDVLELYINPRDYHFHRDPKSHQFPRLELGLGLRLQLRYHFRKEKLSYKYKFLLDQSLDQKCLFHWKVRDSKFHQNLDFRRELSIIPPNDHFLIDLKSHQFA